MKTNGRGTIVQLEKDKPRGKCRKWRLRVSVGLNPRTGKYTPRTRTFIGTYSEAVSAIRSFADEVASEKRSDGRKITVEQLADEWVEHRRSLKLASDNTLSKNKYCLQALSMHVGKIRADKLEPHMITDAIKALMAGDSPSGKALSGTYANMIVTAGSSMYVYATKHGLAPSDPFGDVDLPKIDTQEREPLSDERAEELLSLMTPTDGHHVAVALELLSGTRVGESTALKWRHVDLMDDTMLVPGTKTASSRAVVPITERLSAYLLEWKEYQRLEFERLGIEQSDETYVVSNRFGERLDAHAMDRWWRKNREAIGFGGIKLHDLRHTFATDLAIKGLHPKVIQALMRHKDERMAVKVYTHVNTEQMRDALSRIAED